MSTISVINLVDYLMDRYKQPEPRYTVKAMLERSLLLEEINEMEAQLDVLKPILWHTLAELSQTQHCADWQTIIRMIDVVDALERSADDDRRTLNDSGLWEQEGSNV